MLCFTDKLRTGSYDLYYICQRRTCDTDHYCADEPETSTFSTTTSESETAVTTADPQVHFERLCSCSLSNAWLDVILVIDVSAGMSYFDLKAVSKDDTKSALISRLQLTAFLLAVVKDVKVGQGLVHETRIAVVTYATKSSVYAPLEKYSTYEQMVNDVYGINVTVDDEINIAQ